MKYSKKILAFYCVAALSFSALTSSILTTNTLDAIIPQYASSDANISPQSDDIGWRYKTVNGKKYMRLYNYSTNQWIGDWILVP